MLATASQRWAKQLRAEPGQSRAGGSPAPRAPRSGVGGQGEHRGHRSRGWVCGISPISTSPSPHHGHRSRGWVCGISPISTSPSPHRGHRSRGWACGIPLHLSLSGPARHELIPPRAPLKVTQSPLLPPQTGPASHPRAGVYLLKSLCALSGSSINSSLHQSVLRVITVIKTR